jgi:hypothetical protein
VERGFVGRSIDTSGDYQQWWDGQQIATSFMQDMTYKDGGKWHKTRGGQRTAYDGKEFRAVPNVDTPMDIAIMRKPEHRLYENFFVTFWVDSQSPVDQLLSGDPKILSGISVECNLVTVGGPELIRITGRPQDNRSQAATVYYLDPRRGYGMVKYEWRDDEGKVCSRGETELTAVAGGKAWLPSMWKQEAVDSNSGNITVQHTYRLDMNKCRFGKDANFSDDVFSSVPIGPHAEVSDYRGGARLNYDLDITPLTEKTLANLTTNQFPDTAPTDRVGPKTQTPVMAPGTNGLPEVAIVRGSRSTGNWLVIALLVLVVCAAVGLAVAVALYRRRGATLRHD